MWVLGDSEGLGTQNGSIRFFFSVVFLACISALQKASRPLTPLEQKHHKTEQGDCTAATVLREFPHTTSTPDGVEKQSLIFCS